MADEVNKAEQKLRNRRWYEWISVVNDAAASKAHRWKSSDERKAVMSLASGVCTRSITSAPKVLGKKFSIQSVYARRWWRSGP